MLNVRVYMVANAEIMLYTLINGLDKVTHFTSSATPPWRSQWKGSPKALDDQSLAKSNSREVIQ